MAEVLLKKVVPKQEKLDEETSDIVQLKEELGEEESGEEELGEEPDENQFEKDENKIGKKTNLEKINEQDPDDSE